MKKKENSFFWLSFTDLMTSLFFIMLVSYVLTYIMLKNKEIELENIVRIQKEQLSIIETVEENLKPLKSESEFFRYEPEYRRFTLAFDVKFIRSQVGINDMDLENPKETIRKIDSAGSKLYNIVENLAKEKKEDKRMKDVSYLVVISGYASKLLNNIEQVEYSRSFDRAWNLWKYWRKNGYDFESGQFKDFIDLQIAGNGWGGLGRFEYDPQDGYVNEQKNQRFIIQIVPKIGNADFQKK